MTFLDLYPIWIPGARKMEYFSVPDPNNTTISCSIITYMKTLI